MLSLLILIAVIVFFIYSFGLLFILSLHPKTRKVADRLFGFRDQTELGELKVKVGKMDKDLEDIKSMLRGLKKTPRRLTQKKKGRAKGD